MKDEEKTDEHFQKELMELHQRIAELEKLNSERTQKENELRTLEQKIHHLFDQEKEGIAIIQDRKVIYVNSLIESLIGYAPEEIIGDFFVDYMHPDELPKVAKYYMQRLAGEDVPPIYETIARHKNGSDVYLEIKASAINYQGKPGLFAIFKRVKSEK